MQYTFFSRPINRMSFLVHNNKNNNNKLLLSRPRCHATYGVLLLTVTTGCATGLIPGGEEIFWPEYEISRCQLICSGNLGLQNQRPGNLTCWPHITFTLAGLLFNCLRTSWHEASSWMVGSGLFFIIIIILICEFSSMPMAFSCFTRGGKMNFILSNRLHLCPSWVPPGRGSNEGKMKSFRPSLQRTKKFGTSARWVGTYAVAEINGAMGSDQRSFTLVWRWHQLLSVSLSNGCMSRVLRLL